MKLLFSIPTGYHLRELVMPLRDHLVNDPAIEKVLCITPAAAHSKEVFAEFPGKFEFHANPDDLEGHKKLLQQLQPDVVVTDTVGHDPLDYPILKAAQELGIPTVTFIASWDNVWKIGRLIENKVPIVVADRVAVWNTMMKDHFIRLFPDVASERVEIIGAPRLDFFSHADRIPSKEALYQYLGFTDTSRPLLHFSTTELYPMDYLLEAIHQAVKTGRIDQEPYIYASVHPGGNMDNHAGLKKFGATVRYSFGRKEHTPHTDFKYNPTFEEIYMLVALFKHTSVLINHSSSTALESMLADVPVINVKYGRSFDWWRWYRSMVYRDFKQHYKDITQEGGTTIVKNHHQLIKAIQMYLKDPSIKREERKRTVKKMITTTDGTASKQVLDFVKKGAKSKHV